MKKFTIILGIVFMQISLFAQIPTDSLVFYMPFNGNFVDVSGHGNDLVNNGVTLTDDKFGNHNSASFFNGDNNFIKIQDTDILDSTRFLTISCNISSNNLGTEHYYDFIPIISKWFSYSHPDSCSYLIYLDGDNVNFHVNDGINRDTLATNIIFGVNEWVHMACQFDNGIMKIYLDGVLTASKTSSISYINNSYASLEIGGWFKDYNLNYSSFDGEIDDVRIYRKALSENEIITLSNEGLCYETITVTDTLIINANITGYNPIAFNNTIKIYPNPASDHITIDIDDNSLGYKIKIINTLSQEVFNSTLTQPQYYLNLSNWTGNGTYFVQFFDTNNNLIDVKKIIIQ